MTKVAVKIGQVAAIGAAKIQSDKLADVKNARGTKPSQFIIKDVIMSKDGSRESLYKTLAVYPEVDKDGNNETDEIFVWAGSLNKHAKSETLQLEQEDGAIVNTRVFTPSDNTAELIAIGGGIVKSATFGEIKVYNFQPRQSGGVNVG